MTLHNLGKPGLIVPNRTSREAIEINFLLSVRKAAGARERVFAMLPRGDVTEREREEAVRREAETAYWAGRALFARGFTKIDGDYVPVPGDPAGGVASSIKRG